ncbi:hypothetical protein C1637_16255 [Chryseobacterium lactis]|uniref:histidine kinase n=1 Tax=Chryseobacterium lactis TaxID=1241981 RepID=A0A3G6RJP5_CHRLC|nr:MULTISPECIES: ATP-binding protein [Weeksellaceae]OJV55610.1 MAG: hypothetical protein BGO31_19870 [Bacteroidetes bacterium 43-16]AZA84042.1 hypothetical protein EG342_20095 [Chryseobacterium lactis]AZB04428.1 hypothetical protein EG341_10970 [Chryseobacterium lactis]MCT3745555.1 hypothetical protein [Elizabethkingia anophelis]MDC8027092.1 histidine kinase [Elizabethkingia anophelis]
MENETELKILFYIGTAVMALSVLAVILLIVAYRSKINYVNRRESESLLRSSLESEKRERKRIASDLHDSISGDLSAIQNYITILHNKEKDTFKKSIFLEIETALGNVLENVQDISYNLMPPMLESLGLISTLRSYFSRIRKWNNVTIYEECVVENVYVPSSKAYELYRIIQELINNMIRHGKSSRIDFTVNRADKWIVFEISDNGTAFDFYKSVKEPNGMGLKNITSRMRHIGANLTQLDTDTGNKLQIHIENEK